MPRVLAIVAPNGLGHFRRTCALLDGWLAQRPSLEVAVVAERWQADRLADFGPAARVLSRARLIEGVTGGGVTLEDDESTYDDDRLRAWEARLFSRPELASADLVLSDNLTAVLAARADAVLVGSFLWSDVFAARFPDSPFVRAFVQEERQRLAETRPPMLAVGSLVMPGVIERTRAIPFGFFCDDEYLAAANGRPGVHPEPPSDESPRSNPPPASAPRVAVLGGATGLADRALRAVAARFVEVGAEVFVPPGWLAGMHHPALRPFEYGPAAYDAVDVVVARPGVGTVTECVARRTPFVSVYEPNNVELAHNARVMEALGVARDAGAFDPLDPVMTVDHVMTVDPVMTVDHVMTTALALLRPEENRRARERLASLPTDGVARAVEWLDLRVQRTRPAFSLEQTT